jgi:hypothetical protein
MAKYLMLWDLNQSMIPVDAKERGSGYELLLTMVNLDIEKGLIKDWGAFVGESAGYCVVEGSEVQIGIFVQQYTPYVTFKTHPAASYDQVNEVVKSLSG